nr:unnamed protein product [Callosobruchus analis]
MFYNYKNYSSIVLMAVIDANYHFLMVDVGASGKDGDAGVFSNSPIYQNIENDTLPLPKDQKSSNSEQHVIVGDEAFPLSKHLLRPFPGTQIRNNISKRTFNYRLSRARRLSENAFGILTQVFRIYQRRLKMNPEHVDKIILATCCLHNFLRPALIPVQSFDNNLNNDNIQN